MSEAQIFAKIWPKEVEKAVLWQVPDCHTYFRGVATTVTTDMGREYTDKLAAHDAGFKVARLSFACVIKVLQVNLPRFASGSRMSSIRETLPGLTATIATSFVFGFSATNTSGLSDFKKRYPGLMNLVKFANAQNFFVT